MARNKRKNMKDKDQIKQIRKEARKGWRNKKANKKALEDIQKEAIAGKKVIRLPSYREKNRTNQEPPKTQVVLQWHVKKINPWLKVRSQKVLALWLIWELLPGV